MSLLEDVFLEDEAGEAQELERIIEGDEYDERPRPTTPDSDDNSEKEDEAEEDKRRVDPISDKSKRIVKNPRVVLNPARLTGPRGIQVIPDHFKDFKFKGKGHEKEDLDLVLKKLEHWAYRLYPKFEFADCLKKIETLGKKRPVMVHLTKIRSDQFISDETVVQRDSSDDEAAPDPVPEEDEFDKLLQQQIELARATPGPGSVRKPAFSTPMVDKIQTMTKATSSPSINEEQRERMLRNRQMAEGRRLARLKQDTSETSDQHNSTNVTKNSDTNENFKEIIVVTSGSKGNENSNQIDEDEILKLKNNKSNVIDSSYEDDSLVINESIMVAVHNSHRDSEKRSFDDGSNEKEISFENDVEMNDIEVSKRENDSRISEINFDTSEKHTNVDNISDKELNDNYKEIESTDESNKGNKKIEEIDHETSAKHSDNDNNVEISDNDTEIEPTSRNPDVLKSNNDNLDVGILRKLDTENDSINVRSQGEDNHNIMVDQGVDKTNIPDGKEIVEDKELGDVMDIDFSDDF